MRRQALHRSLAAALALLLITMTQSGTALAEDQELHPSFASDPIPSIWARADGNVGDDGSSQSWIWGPVIRSATEEPYADSPDGKRSVYYFDKARMEINNPETAWDSIWYATSGLLIKEMILGQIQTGDHESVQAAPAEIPVTGDLENNPSSPTYATLGQHTTLGDQDHNRAEDRTGQPLTTFMHADGSLNADFSPPVETTVAYYDDTLGKNVPDVFWDWMNSQAIGWEYLVGHPVTGAYWVDTMIDGEPGQVMVQAFERRVLTFNPANEADWQVEAGNAGLHYRAWRELSVPDDESLHALAHDIPYGEIIVDAAVKNDIDPYMLAGVAEAASEFDPAARLTEDRVGLLGIPEQIAEQQGLDYPVDPTVNTRSAADLLAMLQNETGDWRAAVERYFGLQDAVGTFSSVPQGTVEAAISAGHAYRNELRGQPSPYDFEPEPIAPPPAEEEPPAEEDDQDEDEIQTTAEPDENGLRFIGSGRAAYYGQGYSVADMEDILEIHASGGGAIDGWDYDPNGYYCVHPDYRPGERLYLTADDGETAWCTIADAVARHHVTQWRASWAIEMNWKLFVELGLLDGNHVEVWAPVE